jgi:exopolyphosphatase/guanosine-5'-triphosphate,3'-diphosphate pyrophosphatase
MHQTSLRAEETDPFAVIDIGSNSVRLVVYHHRSRVPIPVFNEKYYCALGRGLAQTGKLNPEGVPEARAALGRFAALLRQMKISDISAVATAAIRSAQDGQDFIAQVNRDFGISISVIDGRTEATLAASGIRSAFHHPRGMVADLGGGSLELSYLDEAEISQQQSLPFGSLELAALESKTDKNVRSMLRRTLQHPVTRSDILYVIGGSFRNLAKYHCMARDYPLGLIHGYTLSLRQLSALIRKLEPLDADDFAAMPGIAVKRTEAMYPAALLLRELMRLSHAEEVIFSVSGIREGLAYSRLDDAVQAEDPLIAGARDLGMLAGRSGTYAKEVFDWSQPLFTRATPQQERLRRALSMIGEVAWTIDPQHRAAWAWDRVIHSAIKGLTHRERVMLALALYHRYSSRWKLEDRAVKLLSKSERMWAQTAGLTLYLAFQFSGGRAGNLSHVTLELNQGTPWLSADKEAGVLFTSVVDKKLANLAAAYSAWQESL